ncbi:hypothetical protein [Burkholderia vietnamiensis]|uniref:hypothetical protein n=1 Tax=Burkholderia vietnamiensis TaxID=60552 RepID=UPI0020123690|nr:hypothetical protein [Burkholderia vietnamiensis]
MSLSMSLSVHAVRRRSKVRQPSKMHRQPTGRPRDIDAWLRHAAIHGRSRSGSSDPPRICVRPFGGRFAVGVGFSAHARGGSAAANRMRMLARRRKPGAAFDRFDAGLRSHALSPSMAAACAVHAARADRRGRHMSHSSASMGGRRRDGKLNIRQAAIQKTNGAQR